VGLAQGEIRTAWDTALTASEGTSLLQKRVNALRDTLLGQGYSQDDVAKFLQNFKVTFKAEVDEKSGEILQPAMEAIFGPDGKMALSALNAATHSPNFAPAMDEVLGANGKMAEAAKKAAGGANFDPAEKDLEQKVQKTLTDGFEAGGTKGAQEAGKKLHEKISGGATELGNILTSIPNLVTSVTSLGEAWDKPNKGLGDYMSIMSGLGNVGLERGRRDPGLRRRAAAGDARAGGVQLRRRDEPVRADRDRRDRVDRRDRGADRLLGQGQGGDPRQPLGSR